MVLDGRAAEEQPEGEEQRGGEGQSPSTLPSSFSPAISPPPAFGSPVRRLHPLDRDGDLGLGALDHVPLVQHAVEPRDRGHPLNVRPQRLVAHDDQVVGRGGLLSDGGRLWPEQRGREQLLQPGPLARQALCDNSSGLSLLSEHNTLHPKPFLNTTPETLTSKPSNLVQQRPQHIPADEAADLVAPVRDQR